MPDLLEVPTAPLRAENQSTCFGCGPAHPTGLRLEFVLAGDGSVTAQWLPHGGWQGFRGMVHGGIISTVLDEAMAKAVSANAALVPTAELRVRFRRPVTPWQEFCVRGWIVENAKRRIRTEAAITGLDGEEFAHAWGTFLPLAPKVDSWKR